MNQLFALITVDDTDAASFLQGQLTQDVRRLAVAAGLPAAWCNAQGRVITFVRMYATGENSFALVVPRMSLDDLLRRLAMYRLRSRVLVAPGGDDWRAAATRCPDDHRTLASIGLLPEPGPFSCRATNDLVAFDLGASKPCIEIYGPASAFRSAGLELRQSLSDAGWQAALVDAGVPQVTSGVSEKFTAHMLNLDLLGAISFDKGCYTGQEVIARTQHLGASKRRLMKYRLEGGGASTGHKLSDGGTNAGEIVNVAGKDLLAVVPLACSGRVLETDGHRATPAVLPYAIPGAD